jgi:nicotinamidase-related amidase
MDISPDMATPTAPPTSLVPQPGGSSPPGPRRRFLKGAGLVGAGALLPVGGLLGRAAAAGPGASAGPSTSRRGGATTSYTPLDPSSVAVLFADLQAGIMERATTVDLAHLRRGVSALARLARLFGLPAVVTTAPTGSGAPTVAPELAAALGDLPPHTRTTTDAFTHPATRAAILATGRKVLLVAGVATEIIVQHSALSALAHGLEAQVVVDACGGLSPRTEDAAFRRMTQAGVISTSIASLAGQLAGELSQPRAQQALSILYEMSAP